MSADVSWRRNASRRKNAPVLYIPILLYWNVTAFIISMPYRYLHTQIYTKTEFDWSSTICQDKI